jgi:hypothetical protein
MTWTNTCFDYLHDLYKEIPTEQYLPLLPEQEDVRELIQMDDLLVRMRREGL